MREEHRAWHVTAGPVGRLAHGPTYTSQVQLLGCKMHHFMPVARLLAAGDAVCDHVTLQCIQHVLRFSACGPGKQRNSVAGATKQVPSMQSLKLWGPKRGTAPVTATEGQRESVAVGISDVHMPGAIITR
jgi:hypothetical protein